MLTDKLGFSWISSSFRRDRVARATYWPGSAATGYAKLGEEVPQLNGLVGRSHQILKFFPELPQFFQPGVPRICKPSGPGTSSAMQSSRTTPTHFGKRSKVLSSNPAM